MERKEKYKIVYECAKEFLHDLITQYPQLNETILKEHLEYKAPFNSMEDANRRLIISLANRNMMSAVIRFEDREALLKPILCDYNPRAILEKYASPDQLFRAFQKEFQIKNAKSKRNLWLKFSEGILSGARFLSIFKDKEAFDQFIKNFSFNQYTKVSLPMVLEKEIQGFGFALACDFLKELGYRDYPKPDVHLIKIFSQLQLSPSSEPYEVYKSIVEMAETVGEDAYTVDKTFWLISSGYFYLISLKIGSHREAFIQSALKKI